MQTVFRVLVMLTTAAHMVFGCCLHHAHSCDTNCCASPGPKAEACPCGTHNHHHDGHDHGKPSSESESPEDCPCKHECDGVDCVALMSESLEGDGEQVVNQFCPLPCNLESCDIALASAVFDRIVDRLPPSAHPPLRLHLLKQVLLI